MLFQKGQSGNPSGRPRGSRNRATILFQNVLEDDAEAIARKAVDMAKAGDIAAIRICMDRLAPARRNDAIVFELPPIERATDTVVAAATIVAAVGAGDLRHGVPVILVAIRRYEPVGDEKLVGAVIVEVTELRAPRPSRVRDWTLGNVAEPS